MAGIVQIRKLGSEPLTLVSLNLLFSILSYQCEKAAPFVGAAF
ncbi:hypothetical protein [Sporolactobacillus inulinus]|nr:hypothetical protein [Sporolactobacillus inulinus]